MFGPPYWDDDWTALVLSLGCLLVNIGTELFFTIPIDKIDR